MNEITGTFTADPFESATADVNLWRGRCLSSFTRAEQAVTEALVTLADGDANVALPHLVGQRFGSLLTELRKREGLADLVALTERFQRHDELRSFLCHGVARVLLDRNGGWHAAFTLVTLVRQKADRRLLLVCAVEAAAIANELRRDQQRLESKLRLAVPAAVGRDSELVVGRALRSKG